MKSVSERTRSSGVNGWGRPIDSEKETFEVEETDVGHTKPNYRGYQRGDHKFTRADVGRRITQYWYEGWTSWTFND